MCWSLGTPRLGSGISPSLKVRPKRASAARESNMPAPPDRVRVLGPKTLSRAWPMSTGSEASKRDA
eukprot:scaffold80881_cov63-Phaeocystis_antarctica.AAC.3